MDSSKLFRLNIRDLAKGLVVAVLAVVLGALQQALAAHGLDVMSYDWAGVLDVAWKAGVVYVSKNLLSDEDGRVLGKIG